jgi:predicted RNase H-like nuclease (RuvC/YqgF family)
MPDSTASQWLALAIAAVSGGGLVALLRVLLFRHPEARKMSADAEVQETKARIEAETSEFGRVNALLDRYERRALELEKRLDDAERQLAALREEIAELRPKAKMVPGLEEEIKELRAEVLRLRDEIVKIKAGVSVSAGQPG